MNRRNLLKASPTLFLAIPKARLVIEPMDTRHPYVVIRHNSEFQAKIDASDGVLVSNVRIPHLERGTIVAFGKLNYDDGAFYRIIESDCTLYELPTKEFNEMIPAIEKMTGVIHYNSKV